MIGKQLINGIQEYGIPYLSSRQCCRKEKKEYRKQWEIDQQLNEFDWQMLVPEYLEMSNDQMTTMLIRCLEDLCSSNSIWFCHFICRGISVSCLNVKLSSTFDIV